MNSSRQNWEIKGTVSSEGERPHITQRVITECGLSVTEPDMPDHIDSADWSDVDARDDPEQFTDYLETVTGAKAVQAYKRRSHQLLRPSRGDRILDVGCGTGQDVLMLAELVGPDGEVVGVDNSETMVETARQQGNDVPTVRFAVEDALDLPFADSHFDAARVDRILQHLEAPAEAIMELQRVTKPCGRIGLSDSDWETMILAAPGGYSEAFLSMDYATPRTPTMGRHLYRYAREAGLTEIDVDTWTPVSTDLAFIRQAGELDTWTDAMRAAGEVTESEVEQWYQGLEQADERGMLFGSLTGFTVAGTVAETA